MGLRGAGGGGGGGADGGEPHGILEGISSLHSWIKTQTMIRPHPGMGRRGKLGGYDEVSGEGGRGLRGETTHVRSMSNSELSER